MKQGFWIAAFTLLLVGCDQPLKEKEIGKYANGQAKMIQYFEEQESGDVLVEEKHYHENGKLKMEGKFAEGERDGRWKAYFKNGQVQSEGEFDNGLREGISLVYYSNGNMMYQGQYSNDLKSGHWKFYNESGKLVKEEDF